MFISLHALEFRPLEFKEELSSGTLHLGPDARQSAPLNTQGRAELIREHQGGRGRAVEDIRLVGQYATTLEFSCARCLEQIQRAVSREFDLLYRPLGVDAGHEELSVTQVEAEIGYYQDGGLELHDVLREQLLLQVPLKAVCREDCKGLCPQCGRNLNEAPCGCQQKVADPRWSALENIKKKLQS